MGPRTRRILLPAAIGALIAALAGCTFEPGRWYGSMSPSLTAGYVVRPDRAAGPGWQMLSNDYQIEVTAAGLELGDIRLLSAATGATRFDPARPPPGYGACHNGHCHSADGRLVPYAEIEAELAGGAGGALPAVVTLPVRQALDLLAPTERPLPCDPSCNLDRARIVRAIAPVAALSIEGRVRDSRLPPRLAEVAFRWQAGGGQDAGPSPPPSALEAALDLPLDDRHPPDVALALRVELGASLFDGVDFTSPTPMAGVLDLTSNPAAAAQLRTNLGEGAFLAATVSRQQN